MIKTLTLEFKTSNCQYSCLHCDGAKHDQCDHIPVQKIKETALSFLHHKGVLFEHLYIFISDSAFLYNDFPELVGFLDEHGIRYKKEPINGVRFDRFFFESKFPEIAASSLETVRITLFGLKIAHDKFTGHKNSFNELMTFAKAFSAYQKQIVFHLYVTPESINEIGLLVQYLASEFPDAVFTYEYSNCYRDNYSRRHRFLLSQFYRETAETLGLSLVSDNEFAVSLKGKKPVVWHNDLWIRIFGSGDCHAAVFPLGSFYQFANLNSNVPETIIKKGIKTVQDIEKNLPSYNCLIDKVFDPEDPFLYAPYDALGLWWARYIRNNAVQQ